MTIRFAPSYLKLISISLSFITNYECLHWWYIDTADSLVWWYKCCTDWLWPDTQTWNYELVGNELNFFFSVVASDCRTRSHHQKMTVSGSNLIPNSTPHVSYATRTNDLQCCCCTICWDTYRVNYSSTLARPRKRTLERAAVDSGWRAYVSQQHAAAGRGSRWNVSRICASAVYTPSCQNTMQPWTFCDALKVKL